MTNSPVIGKKILLTRPKQQITGLSKQLRQLGAEPIAMPVIEIAAIERQNWPSLDLASYSMVVFVSCHAVSHFREQYPETVPTGLRWIAVGAATAECMRSQGLPNCIQAPKPFGTEALLSLPSMQELDGESVLIIRAETGRERLAETLKKRGARVDYLAVYRRILAQPAKKKLAQAVNADWLVVTSVAGLDNLCLLVNKDSLQSKLLLVVSQRIAQEAKKQGFKHIIVTNSVTDQAIVDRIVEVETA